MFSRLTGAALVAALATVRLTSAWDIPLPPCTEPFKPFVYSGCYSDEPGTEALTFRSSISSRDMTVETCVAECKGNGYRYAGLEYYGECFCGQTVNGARLDEDQCTFPCSGNATETCGGNSKLSVWADPTFESFDDVTIEDYTSIGCYTDDSKIGRTLPEQYLEKDADSLTTEKCLHACKNQGFPIAGTEFGRECWCGVVIGNFSSTAPINECNVPCKGDDSETCGGRGRLSLYVARELQSLEPCGSEGESSSSVTSSTQTKTTYSSTETSSVSTTEGASSTTCSDDVTTTTSEGHSSTKTSETVTSNTSEKTSTTSDKVTSTTSDYTSKTSETETSKTSEKTSSTTDKISSTTSDKATTTTDKITPSPTSETITSKTSETITSKTTDQVTTTSDKETTTSPVSSTITSFTITTKPTGTATTSSALCTTTVVTPPQCEYECGSWCCESLPPWGDWKGCKEAHASCKLQISSCFKHAGWPASMQCFEFAGWCALIDQYCLIHRLTGGGDKSDCFGQFPPHWGGGGHGGHGNGGGHDGGKGTTSTSVFPCSVTTTEAPPTTTSTTPSTTTSCPVETPTGLCKQPSSDKYGYGPGNPVGGIELPIVTCNDLEEEFEAGDCWKLYIETNSHDCPSWGRPHLPSACGEACREQYEQCESTYAKGCDENGNGGDWGHDGGSWDGDHHDNDGGDRWSGHSGSGGFGGHGGLGGWPWSSWKQRRTFWGGGAGHGGKWGDNGNKAREKCRIQYKDCLAENKHVTGKGKCWKFGEGW